VRPSSVCLFIYHSSLSVNLLIHLPVLSTVRLSITTQPYSYVCLLSHPLKNYLLSTHPYIPVFFLSVSLFIILPARLKNTTPSVCSSNIHPLSVHPFQCHFIHLSQSPVLLLARTEAADMNGRFQMQGGKNWILPK
jgi:hypothetical protein